MQTLAYHVNQWDSLPLLALYIDQLASRMRVPFNVIHRFDIGKNQSANTSNRLTKHPAHAIHGSS